MLIAYGTQRKPTQYSHQAPKLSSVFGRTTLHLYDLDLFILKLVVSYT